MRDLLSAVAYFNRVVNSLTIRPADNIIYANREYGTILKMKYVFNFLYLLAALISAPKFIYRRLRFGRYRAGWPQRLGKLKRKNPEKKSIWLHAVSVGEANASRTLVEKLSASFPQYEIVITTTTDTGFARASQLFAGKNLVSYFPFDFSFTMRRAFKNINPAAILLMELELWPNLVSIANQQNVPVIVVNGRISDRSFPRYKLIRPLIKKVFFKTSLILAQTEQYAGRFIELGAAADKVFVTGSLKYDTAQIADKVDGSDLLASKLGIKENERLLVAGGTGDGEEEILLKVYTAIISKPAFKDLRIAIIPRKPERFDSVGQLISSFNLPAARYSLLKEKADAMPPEKNAVILGDTMGDLRKFYSLANLIFVGRSLVPMGGSDMAEAAALGKCTIFGPHTFNFNQTVDDLLKEQGAIQIKNEQELSATIEKCLSEPGYAKKIARNGQNVIRKNQGATQKTLEHISKILRP